jgi:hypothetical protein
VNIQEIFIVGVSTKDSPSGKNTDVTRRETVLVLSHVSHFTSPKLLLKFWAKKE